MIGIDSHSLARLIDSKVKKDPKFSAKISSKDIHIIIKKISEAISEEVNKGNTVSIFKLGKFFSSNREPRVGIDFKTLEEIVVPACRTFRFTATKYSKNIINGRI